MISKVLTMSEPKHGFADKLRRIVEDRYGQITNMKKALDYASIVAITDKDGIITYVNDKFCKISKYSRDELIGQNHRILKSGYHPESFYKGIWKVITSGNVWHGDIKNTAKDGSSYWVRTTITPFIGRNGKPEQYIAIRTDITSQKEAEEKLEHTLKILEEAELKKNEFLSMVTHELKTPLTPIIGWCDALQDQEILGKINHDQSEAIDTIQHNAEKLERLISDMLRAYKLDLDKMKFQNKNFKVNEMINSLIKSFEHIAKQKHVSIINLNKEEITLKNDQQS